MDKLIPIFTFNGKHNNILRFLKDLPKNIKYSLQRINKGYCDRDVNDMRLWFCEIIPSMLQEMSNKLDLEDAVVCYDMEEVVGDKATDNYQKELKDKLNKLSYLFNEVFESMIDELQGLGVNQSYTNECKELGFEMFKKLFWNLWVK